MKHYFTPLDAIVLVAYLIATTLLGMWLGRKQRNARDYFVADRTIPWWAILFSVVATETSALTFISIPALAYIGDFTFLQIAAGYLLGRIVLSFTLLPRYYQGDLVTAYALLEQRFGLSTRRFASITFMVTRAFADSVRIFATALPIAFIVAPTVPAADVMPVSILLLGVFTIIYTYHGGMRAVVWTDVVQTCVYLFGGLAAVWLIGHGVPGGWSHIIASGRHADKLRIFDLSLGFDRPQTLLAGLLGGAFLSMASHGADQLIVQRLLAAPSLRDARRALIGSGVAVILQFALFLLIGLGLWSFYHAQTFQTPDTIFPKFIVEVMPPGLTGLVVAAIVAAAMSTVSGSLNSLSAATTHDIYLPLTKRSADDPGLLRVGKLFTLVWAVVLIGGALLYKAQGTPVVIVALAIASFTYGGLLGGFFLGMLWKRAQQRDAITGMAIGITAMAIVVFAKQIMALVPGLGGVLGPVSHVAWPWYVLIGTIITMAAGILSSFTHAAAAAPPDAFAYEPDRRWSGRGRVEDPRPHR
ncbi:MAG TPA: sodium:solute symporter [Gemmatimonadaceae bacterium]|nr:sodium:solute symporter [Gemmatimonadaceae bacterium]